MEGYLVDDMKDIVVRPKEQSLDQTYVVFDLETTGLSATQNRIIEIGAVKITGGKITDRFSTFVNPDVPIPFEIEKLTGISDSMVLEAPSIERVLPEFLEDVYKRQQYNKESRSLVRSKAKRRETNRKTVAIIKATGKGAGGWTIRKN